MHEPSFCSASSNPDLDAFDADADYSAEFLDENSDEDPIGNIDVFPDFEKNGVGHVAEQDPVCSYSQSAEKRKRSESAYTFFISCHKKEFRGQHHDKGKTDSKVIVKDYHVFGDSPDDVREKIWQAVKSHIRREVNVYDDRNMKRVKWANDEDYDRKDMDKFILFKDLQRKRTYRVSESLEKSDVMVKWRGKLIDVYLHIYSLAVANQKLHDLVKRLEAPEDPDRSGACSNKSFQGLINELKKMHPEVTADSFVWTTWAEHVEASPSYKRDDVKQNPPADIQSQLRLAPTDDSAVIEENRRGLFFARTIVSAMEGHVKDLREYSVQLSVAAVKMEQRVSGMEIQLKSYNEMLTSMQRSLAPVENDLSRFLVRSVTDAEDIDHM